MENLIYTASSIPVFITIIVALFVRKTYKGKMNFTFLMLNFILTNCQATLKIDWGLTYC